MRILIAHDAAAGAGGVESYLAALMPALQARGHQLAFVCDGSRSQQGPVRLDYVPTVASITDMGFLRGMEYIRAWQPDACFSHNMRRLAIDESLTSLCPVVKMMHGYFGTCIGGQKAHAFPTVQPCAREFGVACLGMYLPRHCGQLRPASMVSQFAWALRQQRLFGRYAHIVVASAHMACEYARHGVAAERLTSVPLFPTVAPDGSPRGAPSGPTVLFLGRMTSLKGGDVLIRALAHTIRLLRTPVRVLFAGSGPAESSWRALAVQLGVPATFHGWVEGPDRLAILRSASLLAVPSLWPEPFGLVGLEAAAQGVPAVAFDTGGIGEWLQDGVNGRLVRETGSATALGRTLADVLTGSGELARLGEGALRVASGLTLAAHLDVLERVIAGAAVASPVLA
jgi:glycosyltransferase involved in cell wall biosynthesis